MDKLIPRDGQRDLNQKMLNCGAECNLGITNHSDGNERNPGANEVTMVLQNTIAAQQMVTSEAYILGERNKHLVPGPSFCDCLHSEFAIF